GYRARGLARIGIADRVPNGEVTVERTNGRTVLQGGVFHRLRAANEEFGSPLSFGASLPALLYGRDEGFYFRAWGAEVSGTRTIGPRASGTGTGVWGWRLFGERQRSAGDPLGVRNTWSIARALRDSARFLPNIDAPSLDLVGLELHGSRTYGLDPDGWRATTGVRLEGATGTVAYGRGMLDVGASRAVGRARVAVSGMAGSSLGDLPIQRHFFVGGARTVRGQVANTQNGNAFWLSRVELSTSARFVRPVLFFDVGWAGERENFLKPASIGRVGRPQRGVGLGWSTLDGLFRVDLSRGIAPQRLWRLDLYLDARL
nr:BamA/TamA family outer membrane protein [Gemmatimonadaceae bacterium]